MKTLKYNIQINCSPEQVFKVVTDKSAYPKWAAAWGEGMDFSGSWEKGEHIAFFDQSQGGTKAVVEDAQPAEFIKLKHIAMVNPKTEEIPLEDNMMKKWIGTLEQYYFHPEDNGTRLEILIETDEAFQEMMDGPWPKALQSIKDICENAN